MTSQTVADYLAISGLGLLPCHLLECDRFGLSLPHLPAWDPAPEQMFPDATAVFANRDRVLDNFAPNMVVLVAKLTRTVDAEALLSHAFYDSTLVPEWTEAGRNQTAFCGYPTASISGSFRAESWFLTAATRYTVVQPVVDQYLIQVTITTLVSQHDELAGDVRELMKGVKFGNGDTD